MSQTEVVDEIESTVTETVIAIAIETGTETGTEETVIETETVVSVSVSATGTAIETVASVIENEKTVIAIKSEIANDGGTEMMRMATRTSMIAHGTSLEDTEKSTHRPPPETRMQ